MKITLAALCLVLSLLATDAFAQLSYDESTDGDLSGAFVSPTQLIFGTGLNTITGEVGSSSSGGATNGTDADFFGLRWLLANRLTQLRLTDPVLELKVSLGMSMTANLVAVQRLTTLALVTWTGTSCSLTGKHCCQVD